MHERALFLIRSVLVHFTCTSGAITHPSPIALHLLAHGVPGIHEQQCRHRPYLWQTSTIVSRDQAIVHDGLDIQYQVYDWVIWHNNRLQKKSNLTISWVSDRSLSIRAGVTYMIVGMSCACAERLVISMSHAVFPHILTRGLLEYGAVYL